MLLGATTEFNMADKHEIENTLRAHHRQKVEFSPWQLSERLYIYGNETNKQTRGNTDLPQIQAIEDVTKETESDQLSE